MFYDKIRNRKGHAKAIVATAKELLVIIWYMLTRNELYRYMNKDMNKSYGNRTSINK